MSNAARAAIRTVVWTLIFGLEFAITLAVFFTARTFIAAHRGQAPPVDARIDGDGAAPPKLVFACELATEQLQSVFAQQELIDDLKQLNAGVSLSLIDLSAGRAAVVRKLNDAGVLVTAWLALPKEQGYYVNATNAPEAAARFNAFEKWTSDSGLRWAGVGLDIEPNLQEFRAATQGHAARLAAELVRRSFDAEGVYRARNAYAALIRRVEADGYRVETYQFPFLADERKVHSTVLERLLGLVDVRGDREVFMTYTSFNHAIDSALIWEYGPEAQMLAVGSTAGDPLINSSFGPLSWDEFSRDLIVAGHFSRVVGIYSLEGCIRKGFLPRLRTMNWGQSVTIRAEAQSRVIQLRARIQSALWIGSRLPYFAIAIVIVDVWLVWLRRKRNRSRFLSPATAHS